MNRELETETSLSLLKRLKIQPTNEEAWREFVARYDKKILGWCRYWGLQEADASDVTQNVLLTLSKEIGKFEKREGGSFRAWLKTVAHHNVKNLKRVAEFYEYHKTVIDECASSIPTRDFLSGEDTGRRYTKAKIVDMAGFQKGYDESPSD